MGGRAKRRWKERKKKKPFCRSGARAPSPPHLSFTDRLERSGVRGRKEEVQMRRTRRTRGQKEGQTGRPERGTRGCHGYRRIPASPRCHGDGGTLSRSPICSFRSLCLSLSHSLFVFSTLCLHTPADSLALAKFRPTRSRAPIFSPATTSGSFLSRARSVLPSRRESAAQQREGSRKSVENTRRRDNPRICVRMRDILGPPRRRRGLDAPQFDSLINRESLATS